MNRKTQRIGYEKTSSEMYIQSEKSGDEMRCFPSFFFFFWDFMRLLRWIGAECYILSLIFDSKNKSYNNIYVNHPVSYPYPSISPINTPTNPALWHHRTKNSLFYFILYLFGSLLILILHSFNVSTATVWFSLYTDYRVGTYSYITYMTILHIHKCVIYLFNIIFKQIQYLLIQKTMMLSFLFFFFCSFSWDELGRLRYFKSFDLTKICKWNGWEEGDIGKIMGNEGILVW